MTHHSSSRLFCKMVPVRPILIWKSKHTIDMTRQYALLAMSNDCVCSLLLFLSFFCYSNIIRVLLKNTVQLCWSHNHCSIQIQQQIRHQIQHQCKNLRPDISDLSWPVWSGNWGSLSCVLRQQSQQTSRCCGGDSEFRLPGKKQTPNGLLICVSLTY